MHRQTLAAVGFAAVLVLAGCGGVGTPTDADTTTSPPSMNGPVDYEVMVFDTGFADQPLIEGGLSPSLGDHGNASYYATLLTQANETDRFDWNALPESASEFVNDTDFDRASILVVQAFPKSSVPDYRVESVIRSGDALDVRINDSSGVGTDDITLETVLIRVDHDGPPPPSARITTQNDDVFGTNEGTVTVDVTANDTETDTVTLPLTSDDESRNVEDPRDLTIDNEGAEVVGYNVTVVATLAPDCRDADPPCGMPDRPVVVFHETGKLEPGESRTVGDLIARHGDYEIAVEVDLPDEDDGRRTVTDTFEWRVGEKYFDVFVTVDDGVSITQSSQ